jgi:hypothetical protein
LTSLEREKEESEGESQPRSADNPISVFFTVWSPCQDQIGVDVGPDFLNPDDTVRDVLEQFDLINGIVEQNNQVGLTRRPPLTPSIRPSLWLRPQRRWSTLSQRERSE